MLTPSFLHIARTISTYLLAGAVHAEVSGGIATGKSLVAAQVAANLTQEQERPVWLVAENDASARHSVSLVDAASRNHHQPRQPDHLNVLTVEDYLELAAYSENRPAFVVFDDADRYDVEGPERHGQQTPTLSCTTAALPRSSTHHLSPTRQTHHLTQTRTREEIRRTLEVARMPGVATIGKPTRHILRSHRLGARRLSAAINGWGVTCVPVHRPLTASLGHTDRTLDSQSDYLFRRTADIIRALTSTTVDKLNPTSTTERHEADSARAPTVSLTVSGARSGRGRRITEAEAALSLGASLLEDLAADPPDVVIVIDLDAGTGIGTGRAGPDMGHLARLLSVPTIGAVVVTSANSPTHHTFSQRVLDL